MPYPYGMSVEQCLSFATDVFLRDYMIRPGDVVLDIGAGIGTEALPFAHLAGDAGKVISVEAHPATFAMLERVCRLNDLKNVELVQAAVMDSDEPVMISDMREGFCQENRVGDPGGIEVPGVTIADLVAKFNLDRIDFIKMNIEGRRCPRYSGPAMCCPSFGTPRSVAMTSSPMKPGKSSTAPWKQCAPCCKTPGSPSGAPRTCARGRPATCSRRVRSASDRGG